MIVAEHDVPDRHDMSSQGLKLGVVILNWNNCKETQECVSRLNGLEVPCEIFVVDNNSICDIGNASKTTGQYRLLRSEVNRGFSGGNNLGIRAAMERECDLVLLCNNDAYIEKKDLCILQEAMASDARVGVIGPVLHEASTGNILSTGGRDIGWHYFTHDKILHDTSVPYDVDYVPGTIALMRTAVLNAVGLFDERYFFSGEMADLCQRIKGYRTGGGRYRVAIHPKARAMHALHISSEARESVYVYYIVRNRFLYIRKYHLKYFPVLYVYWVYMDLRHVAAVWRQGKRTAARTILRGMVDGLLGRFGNRSHYLHKDRRLPCAIHRTESQ